MRASRRSPKWNSRFRRTPKWRSYSRRCANISPSCATRRILEVRAPNVDSGAPKTLSSTHLIPVDAPVEDLTTTVDKAKKANAKKIYKPWSWVH